MSHVNKKPDVSGTISIFFSLGVSFLPKNGWRTLWWSCFVTPSSARVEREVFQSVGVHLKSGGRGSAAASQNRFVIPTQFPPNNGSPLYRADDRAPKLSTSAAGPTRAPLAAGDQEQTWTDGHECADTPRDAKLRRFRYHYPLSGVKGKKNSGWQTHSCNWHALSVSIDCVCEAAQPFFISASPLSNNFIQALAMYLCAVQTGREKKTLSWSKTYLWSLCV